MSFLRVFLIMMVGFGCSFFLKAMKTEKAPTVSEKRDYLSDDIKKLILFKNADLEDKYGTLIPQDVKNTIVQKNYVLYRDQLFRPSVGAGLLRGLGHTHHKNLIRFLLKGSDDKYRIDQCQGVVIKHDDFGVITMDEEGREVFATLVGALCNRDHAETFVYEEPDLKMMKYRRCCLTQDDYNKILELPIALRCKVGKLCTVTVVGKEIPHHSFSSKVVDGLFFGSVFTLSAIGILANVVKIPSLSPYSVGVFFGGVIASGIPVVRQREKDSLKKHGAKIELLYKPIVTPEEQKMIKKAGKIKSFRQPMEKLLKSIQLDRLNLRSRE
jgi:hypothetical protein